MFEDLYQSQKVFKWKRKRTLYKLPVDADSVVVKTYILNIAQDDHPPRKLYTFL